MGHRQPGHNHTPLAQTGDETQGLTLGTAPSVSKNGHATGAQEAEDAFAQVNGV